MHVYVCMCVDVCVHVGVCMCVGVWQWRTNTVRDMVLENGAFEYGTMSRPMSQEFYACVCVMCVYVCVHVGGCMFVCVSVDDKHRPGPLRERAPGTKIHPKRESRRGPAVVPGKGPGHQNPPPKGVPEGSGGSPGASSHKVRSGAQPSAKIGPFLDPSWGGSRGVCGAILGK